MATKIDRTGQKFGQLTVIKQVENNSHGHTQWLCRCVCGNTITKKGPHLSPKTPENASCGCVKYQVSTHGLTGTREYVIWARLKQRTTNPDCSDYKDYGARGITLDTRWYAFEAFLADMGKAPSKTHSIDRRDNDKGYNKENCYWATPAQQARNKRTTYYVEYKGETKPLVDWCEILNLPYIKTWKRLKTLGWSVEKAFTQLQSQDLPIDRLLQYKL